MDPLYKEICECFSKHLLKYNHYYIFVNNTYNDLKKI